MDKLCSFCGNRNFRIAQVEYVYRRDDKFLVVRNVPCEECEFCGEQYFDAGVLKRIEREFDDIYQAGKKATREVLVPVEEFAQI